MDVSSVVSLVVISISVVSELDFVVKDSVVMFIGSLGLKNKPKDKKKSIKPGRTLNLTDRSRYLKLCRFPHNESVTRRAIHFASSVFIMIAFFRPV